MENKEQQNQLCYLCEKFSGYYTKGSMRFVRAKLGYCRKHEKIVTNTDTCECWQNNVRKLFSSKKTSLRILSDLLLEEATGDMDKK